MLRTLVDEIVRRRLWPIPLVALAVALAAPLLFLKSAPSQAAPDATAVASRADLPARAQRLLTTTDARASSGRHLSRSSRDPFQAPASASAKATSQSKKKKKAGAQAAASGSGDKSAGDSASTAETSAGGGGTSTTRSTGTSTTRSTGTSTTRSTGDSPITPTVDIRFGAHKDSPIQRRIPRRKTFEVDGEVTMFFAKYSPSRHKAIFAVDSATTLHGDRECSYNNGLCYFGVAAGSYARLTFTTEDGLKVSRRLDVVRFHDA